VRKSLPIFSRSPFLFRLDGSGVQPMEARPHPSRCWSGSDSIFGEKILDPFGRTATKCEVFDSLAALRRDSRIGPAVRGCFEYLWHLTGGRADYIIVTTKQIAFEFGVERRAVEKWLLKLREYGLAEVIDRDKRRGTIHLYVFHPRPERREPRPDPQRRLDLWAPKGPDAGGEASICAPKGPATVGEASICAPKGPAEDYLPRVRASDDSDDKEEVSSSSSLSLSVVLRDALSVRQRLFPDRRSKLKHRDRVFLASVVVVARMEAKSGKRWLNEAVDSTCEHKPDKPIQYLKSVLRERVATELGRCALSEAADEFGRMLRDVRPTVERILEQHDREQAARRAATPEPERADETNESTAAESEHNDAATPVLDSLVAQFKQRLAEEHRCKLSADK